MIRCLLACESCAFSCVVCTHGRLQLKPPLVLLENSRPVYILVVPLHMLILHLECPFSLNMQVLMNVLKPALDFAFVSDLHLELSSLLYALSFLFVFKIL